MKTDRQTNQQEQLNNNNKTPQISYTGITPLQTSKTLTFFFPPPSLLLSILPLPSPPLLSSISAKILVQKVCGPPPAGLSSKVCWVELLCLLDKLLFTLNSRDQPLLSLEFVLTSWDT